MVDVRALVKLLPSVVAIVLFGSAALAQSEGDEAEPVAPVAADASPSDGTQQAGAADGSVEPGSASTSEGKAGAADAWDDDWFDQAQPDASTTEVNRPRYSPLEVEAFVGNLSRSFDYSDDLTGSLRSYAAPSGLLVGGDLAWFPAAHFTARALAHLGFAGHFELGIPQSTAEGIGASTTQWRAGLVGRVPFDGGRLARDGLILGRVEGGRHRFVVDPDSNGATLVPGVEYDFLRVGLGARLNLSRRLLGELDTGVRFPFDEGEIGGPEWFPRARATGVDARVRLGLRFGPLDVLLGAAHERYFFTFDPTPEGPNPVGAAAGATDAYWALTLGLRYSLSPPREK